MHITLVNTYVTLILCTTFVPIAPSTSAVVVTTTLATISVMFYYTPEFEADTPDIITYIDHVLNIANQGYRDSGLPIKVIRHCVELANVKDVFECPDLHLLVNLNPLVPKSEFRMWSFIRQCAQCGRRIPETSEHPSSI